MKLNLYDSDLNRIAIIGNQFISCMWSEGYNTVQPFTLELQATKKYKALVKPDCYVGRDDRKTLMVIKTVRVKSGRIIANGQQATRCLDDVAFVGTIKAGSNTGQALKSAYDASDKFKNFEFAVPNLDVTYDHDISNKSLLTLLETMCQDSDTGFRAVRAGKKVMVELYKPSNNPNRILAEQYGSLKIDTVTLSTENKRNKAVVLGEGEGEARKRVVVDLSNGEQKRTVIVDARNITMAEGESLSSYEERLAARGYEELLKKQGTWECAINPLPQEFGELYDLGDVITVLLPDYNMKLQSRLVRFTQQSQNNVIKTVLEIGTITITR